MITGVVLSPMQGTVGAESFSLLLHDLSIIMRPRRVVAVQASPDNSSLIDHPSVKLLAALSDLSGLFAPHSTGVPGHIQMKLNFYAAQVLSTPQLVLRALANELQAHAQALEAEAVPVDVLSEPRLQGKNLDASQPKQASNLDIRASGGSVGPLIEETF